MSIGQKLLDLRKSKQLSQEEVANRLNVTRQTVSKWETDQSMPDFDKIIPICELYEISADELLSGTKHENVEKEEQKENKPEDFKREKRAKGIGISVLIYFVAVAWIMTSIPAFRLDPIVSSAIFLLICGVATYVIIYTCIVYKKDKKEIEEDALEYISKWLDCFLKVDSQYKNLLGNNFIELLTVKAQGNEELNERLNRVIKGMDVMRKVFE